MGAAPCRWAPAVDGPRSESCPGASGAASRTSPSCTLGSPGLGTGSTGSSGTTRPSTNPEKTSFLCIGSLKQNYQTRRLHQQLQQQLQQQQPTGETQLQTLSYHIRYLWQGPSSLYCMHISCSTRTSCHTNCVQRDRSGR